MFYYVNYMVFNFENIKNKSIKIEKLFSEMNDKSKILINLYLEIIKEHKITREYIFGYDSFQFQSRLITDEINYFNNIYNKILNQMYYELYNIYNLICKNNYITPTSFPEYKDLDNTQKFTLPTIENIHTSILDIIHKLKKNLENKDKYIIYIDNQSQMGINIDNIVNTKKHEHVILKDSIETYYRYINTFYDHNINYLNKLIHKIQSCLSSLIKDITIFNKKSPANSKPKPGTNDSSKTTDDDSTSPKTHTPTSAKTTNESEPEYDSNNDSNLETKDELQSESENESENESKDILTPPNIELSITSNNKK